LYNLFYGPLKAIKWQSLVVYSHSLLYSWKQFHNHWWLTEPIVVSSKPLSSWGLLGCGAI